MNQLGDRVAKLRSSIVGVVSPTNRGSGYCADANGLIVTSLDVVGYEREVQLVLDDGNIALGIVVRANVNLDIALIMPAEPIGLAPLGIGAEPRMGDPVMVLGRVGLEPFLMTPTIVSTGRFCESLAHLQLDGTPTDLLRGAPVVDRNDGVLGVVIRPRRVRVLGDRNSFEMAHGLILPATSYEGGLASAEGSPSEVLELLAEYGCPECDTVFEPDFDRCLECGTLLPHRFVRGVQLDRQPVARGVFAAKAALASLGIPANRARIGRRTWRFSPAIAGETMPTHVDLTMDSSGGHLVLHAPLCRLPQDGFEPLYRHLLTLNDETGGPFRFGISGSQIYLSLCEPILSVGHSTFPTTVSDFSAAIAQYRDVLGKHFGLENAYEMEVD